MVKNVSILGCGWLGLPLAKSLIGDGYHVKGSTTSEEKLTMLRQAGIKPYLIKFSPETDSSVDTSFFQSEILIINIPPGRRKDDVEIVYPQQISEILKLHPPKQILFVSSTSVYPDLNRPVTENDIPSEGQESDSIRSSGRALLKAENLVKQYSKEATIVRFCGLMGPDRHPGKFLSGKKLESQGKAPVNFIHLTDCISVLKTIMLKEAWGRVFNACADQHPAKEKFYLQATSKLELPPPKFSNDSKLSYKEVNSNKLKEELNYKFTYADPTDCL